MKGRFAAALALGTMIVALGSSVGMAASGTLPTFSQIAQIMHSYREVGTPAETYAPLFSSLTPTPDGRGATATAVVGVRSPSADDYGQLVFFFYNNCFVGLNSAYEAVSVKGIVPLPNGGFRVTYANYKRSDPLYAPSLAPVTITYHVHGHSVTASAPLGAGVNDLSGRARRESVATRADIATIAASFRAVGVPGESYRPLWNDLKTTMGLGNLVDTAVPAVRGPSSRYGKIVLFFSGDCFVGPNSPNEATNILSVASVGLNQFRVTYANYAPNDAPYDPTLPPVTITYQISGGKVKASAPLPAGVIDKLKLAPKS